MRRLLAVLASALVFGACGGEDDQSSAPQSTPTATSEPSQAAEGDRLSRAEFTMEGTRICRQGARKSARLAKRELSKPKVRRMDATQQRVHVFRASEPLVEETMGKLGRLSPPPEVEANVKTMIADIKESTAVLRAVFDAQTAQTGAELVARLKKLAASSRRAAREAGLEACLPEQTP